MSVLTYNKKVLEQAIAELREYKEPSEYKQDYAYYAIEEYVERMDEVFGACGYRALYSELDHVAFPLANQMMLTMKCRIEILGENGNVIHIAEGYGSEEVTQSSEGTKYYNLTTVAMNCGTYAFKSACKNLGIFACRKVKKTEENNNSNSGNNNSNSRASRRASNASNASKNIVPVTFMVNRPFEVMWKDDEGRPAYRMVANMLVNEMISREPYEILFYPNQYKKAVGTLNDLIVRSQGMDGSKSFRLRIGVQAVAEERRNKNYAGSFTFKRFEEG